MLKPLGIKNYGSIPHLPNSRMGTGDHHVPDGQAAICCVKVRDKHDRIIVTEKLDGSNCGVALHEGNILALGRAGYLAQTSNYRQHQLFAHWVREHEKTFRLLLTEGERAVGEWLSQVHSTRYQLTHEPFVIFDIMKGSERLQWDQMSKRVRYVGLEVPWVISDGSALSVEDAMALVEPSHHGAIDPVEGAVWRVERQGKYQFMAKYVRPEKIDGKFLPELSKQDSIWNWEPKESV